MNDEKYRALGCSQSYAEWLSKNSPLDEVEQVIEAEKPILREKIIAAIKQWVVSWLQRKSN